MERLDAVYDLDISLHGSVQNIVDIRIHTSSSCGLLVHVRLWPYSVFLHQRRLFISTLCIGTRPAELVELPATICHEDRLLVLLLCSVGYLLVRCDLCYDAGGLVEKRFSYLSPNQGRSLRICDYCPHENARDTGVRILSAEDSVPSRLECSRVAVPSLS